LPLEKCGDRQHETTVDFGAVTTPPIEPDINPDAANLDHWQTLARFHGHGKDTYYDVDALISGVDSMRDVENEAVAFAVGDVAGRDVIHIQSHIGFDSITMARRGARVTCVDFSAAALERAREIAALAGVELTTVEADSRALPTSLHGRFDLAYATIGVMTWIDDMEAWMRSAAATLRPGGRLVFVELHPIFCMIDSVEPQVISFPYAFDGPHVTSGTGSYAAVDAEDVAWTIVEYAHSVGEVVMAATGAGLHVELLMEHLDAQFDPRGNALTAGPDGRYRLILAGSTQPLPVLFTLVAGKPAQG
jgi:SAM-dependent methyltransferase